MAYVRGKGGGFDFVIVDENIRALSHEKTRGFTYVTPVKIWGNIGIRVVAKATRIESCQKR